jgi:hypothetical protein
VLREHEVGRADRARLPQHRLDRAGHLEDLLEAPAVAVRVARREVEGHLARARGEGRGEAELELGREHVLRAVPAEGRRALARQGQHVERPERQRGEADLL